MMLSDAQKAVVIALEQGGSVDPALVLEVAKDEDNPLHELFEWDVEKAAMRHWMDTARQIVRTLDLKITVNHITFDSIRYVRDVRTSTAAPQYLRVNLVNKAGIAEKSLEAEITRVEQAIARARVLAKSWKLEQELESRLRALL